MINLEENTTETKTSMMPMIVSLVLIVIIASAAYYFTQIKPKSTDGAMMQKEETVSEESNENSDQMMLEENLKDESNPSDMMEEESMMQKADVTFEISGKNFSFSKDQLTVKKGQIVKIVFTSESGMHDWVLDEFSAKTKTVSNGEQAEVTFVADKTGEFEYYCSVGNHKAMGMVGTLTVTE